MARAQGWRGESAPVLQLLLLLAGLLTSQAAWRAFCSPPPARRGDAAPTRSPGLAPLQGGAEGAGAAAAVGVLVTAAAAGAVAATFGRRGRSGGRSVEVARRPGRLFDSFFGTNFFGEESEDEKLEAAIKKQEDQAQQLEKLVGDMQNFMEAKVDRERAANVQLRDEMEYLREQVSKAQDSYSNACSEMEMTQIELQAQLNVLTDDMAVQRQEALKQRAAAESYACELEARVAEVEAERDALLAQRPFIQKEVKNLTEKVMAAEEEKAEMSQRLNATIRAADGLQQRVVSLESEQEGLRDRIANMTEEKELLDQQISDGKSDKAYLVQQSEVIRSEVARLTQRVVDTEGEKAALAREVKVKEAERAAMEERVRKVEGEKSQAVQEVSEWKAKAAGLEDDNARLQAELEEARATQHELEVELARLSEASKAMPQDAQLLHRTADLAERNAGSKKLSEELQSMQGEAGKSLSAAAP